MQRTELGLVGLLVSALAACAGPTPTDPQLGRATTEPAAPAAEPGGSNSPDEAAFGNVRDPLPMGGQSGTDRPGNEAAPPCPDLEPLDRGEKWDGRSVAELIASVVGTQSIKGEWVLSEAAVDLEISITDLGGGVRAPQSERARCDSVRVPIELSLRIGQSFAVGPVATELVFQAGARFVTGLNFDATAFADPAQLPEKLYEVDGSAALLLLPLPAGPYYPFLPIQRGATLEWGGRTIGAFGEGRYLRHLPLDEVAEDCHRAENMESRSFADEPAALQAISGQWALCEAERRLPFAGIEIRSDRTWSAIRAQAGLELGMGFEQEGNVLLLDTSVMNALPGFFQLNLVGPGWLFPAGPIARSASGQTLRWGDTVVVQLTRPVRAAVPPQFAAGQRAGSAGCASNETEFEPWPLDDAGVQASLVGSWVICSGGSGTVRFDPSGHVELLDDRGRSTRPAAYTAYPDESFGGFPHGYVGSVIVGEGEGDEYWQIVRTSHPVKVQVLRRTIDSVQERLLDTLVLSALPE